MLLGSHCDGRLEGEEEELAMERSENGGGGKEAESKESGVEKGSYGFGWKEAGICPNCTVRSSLGERRKDLQEGDAGVEEGADVGRFDETGAVDGKGL